MSTRITFEHAGELIVFRERVSAALWPVMLEMLAYAWDQGARAATTDYGVGEARNPYRDEPATDPRTNQ